MSVIGESCTLPSKHAPGCGCSANRKAGGKKTTGAVALTALAAAACTSCCILPFTLPAVILAGAGGTIAILDHAHVWVTRVAILAVGCAWIWIVWQTMKAKRSPARSTLVVMVMATVLTAVAASWPVIKPIVFDNFGIVKKHKVSNREE